MKANLRYVNRAAFTFISRSVFFSPDIVSYENVASSLVMERAGLILGY